MTWRPDGPQGNEAAKIKHLIVPYTRGRVLDLGCGPYKAWPHFIGVDNGHHAREFGWQFKPDLDVEDCARLDIIREEGVDAVFSSHLLEHIEDYHAALREWFSLIKPDGHLILYLPDEDEYPRVGEPGANPDHKWNVNYDRVVDAMKAAGSWDLIEFEKRNGGDEYSLLFVFQKAGPGVKPYPVAPEKVTPGASRTRARSRFNEAGETGTATRPYSIFIPGRSRSQKRQRWCADSGGSETS